MLTALSRATPNLRETPGVLYAASGTSDPLGTAQATAGFQQGMFLWRTLNELEDAEQLAAHAKLGDADRALLAQVGYLPPQLKPENRPWWEDAIAGIGRGVELAAGAAINAAPFVLAGVGVAASPVTGGASLALTGVLAGAGAIQATRGVEKMLREDKGPLDPAVANLTTNDITRLYRTTELAFQDIRSEGGSDWNPLSWRPRHFAEAWSRVNDDIPDFTAPPERILTDLGFALAPEHVLMAADRAAGATELEMFQNFGLQETLSAFEDPEFNQAVSALEAEQLSFGRGLARSILGSPHEVSPTGEVETRTMFNIISGVGDGLLWWFSDPTNTLLNSGLKLRAANKMRMLSIRSADDIPRVMQQRGVQRAMDRVASLFAADDTTAAAKLLDEFPTMPPAMVEELAKVKPKTFDEVQDFLEGEAGLLGILQGRYAGYRGVLPHAPYLSKLAPVKTAIKNRTLVGFEKVEGFRPTRRIGGAYRRFTSLVPVAKELDPGDASSVNTIKRIARFSLGKRRSETIVSAWLAADDIAVRQNIYDGLIRDTFHSLGSTDNAFLKAYEDELLAKLTEGIGQQKYAMDGAVDISRMYNAAGEVRGAASVLPHQFGDWTVPDFRKIVDLKRQGALWSRIPGGGHIPQGVINDALSRVWKPIALWRMGFALRNGWDEGLNAIARSGFVRFARAKAASKLVYRTERWAEIQKAYKLKGEEAGIVEALAYRARQARHAAGLPAQKVRKAVAHAMDERLLSASALAMRTHGASLLPETVSSGRDLAGQMASPESLAREIKARDQAGRMHVVRWKKTDKYKGYVPGDELQVGIWYEQLAKRLDEEAVRIAWQHLDDPKRATDAVYDWLASDAGKYARSRGIRSRKLNDGRVVGVDATEEEALRQWADLIVRDSRSLVTGADGTRIEELLTALRSGELPDIEILGKLDEAKRPAMVLGPEMIPVVKAGEKWDNLVSKGFRPLERWIDTISRRPIYISHLADALDEVAPLVREWSARGIKSAQELGERRALALALERTASQVDSAAVRSQFAVMNRTIIPFWHAQEQFIKRWAHVMVHNPDAVRRAQLIMEGAQHSGAVEKDENGDLVFKVPAVMWTFDVLKKFAPLVFGGPLAEGVNFGFSGKLKYLFAGTDSPRGALFPGVSPVVSIPLQILANRIPTLEPLEDVVQGADRPERPVLEQLFPAWGVKAIRALWATEENDGQLFSAKKDAVQYLAAAGHAPSETATADELQVFAEQVERTARIVLFMRAMLGFAGTTPSIEFADNLQPEFAKLIRNHPYEEAMLLYIEKHPDALAWTVSGSEAASIGANIPAGETARTWIESNQGFIGTYGEHAAWLMPAAPEGFNYEAWQLELAHEFRIQRKAFADPGQLNGMWEQIHIRTAQDPYFTQQDRKDAALAATADPSMRAAIRDAWSVWRDQYRVAHPVFARWQDEGQQRAGRRVVAIETIRTMLQDPSAPSTPHVEAMNNVIQGWDAYGQVLGSLGSTDAEDAYRRRVTSAFRTWGAGLMDPVARQMFTSLIAPMLRGDLDG